MVQGSFVPGKCNLKILVFIKYFFTGISIVGFGGDFLGLLFLLLFGWICVCVCGETPPF